MSISEGNEQDVIVLQEDDYDFGIDDTSESHRGRRQSSDFYSGPLEVSNPEELHSPPSDAAVSVGDVSANESGGASNNHQESCEMDTSIGNQSGLAADTIPQDSVNMEDIGANNGQAIEEPMDTAPTAAEDEKKKIEDDTSFVNGGGDDESNVEEKFEEQKATEDEGERAEMEESDEEENQEEGEKEESGEEETGEESEDSSNESIDDSASSSEESGERSAASSRGSATRKRTMQGSTDSERVRAKVPKTAKSPRSKERPKAEKDKEKETDKDKDKGKDRKKRCGEDNRMGFYFDESRYFLIKSGNEENVMLSKAKGVWATTYRNEQMLNKAFRTSRNVLLIFSVERSQKFQGFARIAAESSREHSPVNWVLPSGFNARNLGGIFKLHWINRLELPFSQCVHLTNPWNENKPVKIARDGTEVAPDVGRKLCSLFPSDDGVDLTSLEKKVRRLQENHPYPFRGGGAPRYSETRPSGSSRGDRDRDRVMSRSPPPPPVSGSNTVKPRMGASRGGAGYSGDRWGSSDRRYHGGSDAYNGYYDDRGYGYPYSSGYGGSYGGIPSIYDWPTYHGPPQPLIPQQRYGSYSYGPSSWDRDRRQPPSAYSDPYRGSGRRSPSPANRRSGGGGGAGGGGAPARRRKASSSSGSRSPPQAYKSSSGTYGNRGKRPETPPRYRRERERASRR